MSPPSPHRLYIILMYMKKEDADEVNKHVQSNPDYPMWTGIDPFRTIEIKQYLNTFYVIKIYTFD